MKDMHTKQMHTLIIHIETDLRRGERRGKALVWKRRLEGNMGKRM